MSFETPLPPFNASEPAATFLSASCLDLMMIELVPMAYRVANEVETGTGQEKERWSAADGRMDEDEERDAVFYRLESLGYRVGQGLVERYACC
jgi:trafficking protein particle complex subunit 6